MNKFYLLMLLLFLSRFVLADEMSGAPKTCKDYGCPKCDCVAQHPDLQDKIPNAISQIEKILIKNHIPIEAVVINIGNTDTQTTFLKWECSPACKYDKGAKCCWTFSILGPDNTLKTKELVVE
ncbi:hypothetical protein MA784_004605 [Vibrio parahaemolyticus]|nr:hypothetical protein [Vibrio parahaemolyticus]